MDSEHFHHGTRGGMWGRIQVLRFGAGSRDPGLSAQHNIGLLSLGQNTQSSGHLRVVVSSCPRKLVLSDIRIP